MPTCKHIKTIRILLPHPRCGPPLTKSKTWAGLSSCLKRRKNFTPWLSPLLELTKTRRGLAHDGGQVAFQKPDNKKMATGKQSEKAVNAYLLADQNYQHWTRLSLNIIVNNLVRSQCLKMSGIICRSSAHDKNVLYHSMSLYPPSTPTCCYIPFET